MITVRELFLWFFSSSSFLNVVSVFSSSISFVSTKPKRKKSKNKDCAWEYHLKIQKKKSFLNLF